MDAVTAYQAEVDHLSDELCAAYRRLTAELKAAYAPMTLDGYLQVAERASVRCYPVDPDPKTT